MKESLLLASQIARERPDLVTDWMWKCLITGTIFDVEHRPFAAHGRPRFTAGQLANFRTEAPCSPDLADQALKLMGANPPTEAIARQYGEMAPDFVSRVDRPRTPARMWG